jgi:metallo-beta-lactamase class B
MTISILLFLSLSSSKAQSDTLFVSNDIQLIHLTDSMFIHITWHEFEGYGYLPSNGVVYIKNGEAVIIDTPIDEKETKVLCDYLQNSMKVTIKAVIPGHYHDDCLGGIDYLHDQGVWSFGNELTAKKCAELDISGPKSTFGQSLDLYFNGDIIQLRYLGPGHTFDNIVVYFPKEKVLFGGCLIKSINSQTMGNLADAIVSEWDKSVENVQHAFPDADIVIPGHGPFGGTDLLQHTIDMVGDYKSTQNCAGEYDPELGIEFFRIVEEPPQFPSGEEALFMFLRDNISFKGEAFYSGTMWSEFIIEKNGKITNIEIIRSISPEMDEEYIRVLSLMPDWIPGKCNGKPVNVKMILPLRISPQE